MPRYDVRTDREGTRHIGVYTPAGIKLPMVVAADTDEGWLEEYELEENCPPERNIIKKTQTGENRWELSAPVRRQAEFDLKDMRTGTTLFTVRKKLD